MPITFSPYKHVAWNQRKERQFVVEAHHVEGVDGGCMGFRDSVGKISPFHIMEVQCAVWELNTARAGLESFFSVPSWLFYFLMMCTFLCSLCSHCRACSIQAFWFWESGDILAVILRRNSRSLCWFNFDFKRDSFIFQHFQILTRTLILATSCHQ